MELSELQELLSDPKKLVEKIKASAPVLPDYIYDIEPENHKVVKDLNYRPWRDVEIATGVLDIAGNMTYRTEKRDVHRIPSATQKIIVDWSVRMSLSGGIDREYGIRDGVASDEVMAAMIDKTWEDNKLDYICQKIDRLKKSYTQCMAVWYSVPAEEGFWEGISTTSKFKMRLSVFSPEDGSLAIPLYDRYNDMIACARQYTIKENDKDVEKIDLHLSDRIITYIVGSEDNPVIVLIKYEKANFVFHGRKRTVYADVLPKIERVEEVDSDTADENQQSAFPILAASGEIIASSGGGTKNTRKSFQLENGGDLKYVEAQGSQQSAKDERANMRRDIYDETNTPQISMEQISGSSNIPGVAIEMMFMPATNEAKSDQQGDLGMEWQRHFNFLKPAMAVINIAVKPSVSMQIKPKFKIELPRNLTEEYARIIALVGAGLMSKDTAIAKLAFTDDPVAEYDKILEEAKAAALLVPKPVDQPILKTA
jgi:hypothetical protein